MSQNQNFRPNLNLIFLKTNAKIRKVPLSRGIYCQRFVVD